MCGGLLSSIFGTVVNSLLGGLLGGSNKQPSFAPPSVEPAPVPPQPQKPQPSPIDKERQTRQLKARGRKSTLLASPQTQTSEPKLAKTTLGGAK